MENIKTLNNIRIQSAYYDLDTLIRNDPVLLKGEKVFVDINSEQADSPNYIPCVMCKVGDGVKKFSELDYTYAKAFDVYKWAKKSSLAYDDLPIEKITNSELEDILK